MDASGKVASAKFKSGGSERLFCRSRDESGTALGIFPACPGWATRRQRVALAVSLQTNGNPGVPTAHHSLVLPGIPRKLPHNLPHHAKKKFRVVGFQIEVQDQLAGFLLEHGVGTRLDITARAKRFEQTFGDQFRFCSAVAGSKSFAGRGTLVLRANS